MTIDAIHGHDPAFDQNAFLSRAEAIVALVLRARAEGHLDQARAVVGEDMALRLSAELDGQRAAGRHQVHGGVRVRSSQVVEAGSDGSWDTIAVRFSLEGVAYEATADGKPVPGAATAKRRWSEVWWFRRQADATTSPTADVPLDRCPGCGAPLASTGDGRCTYCQRPLASPTTWVLTRVSDSAPTPEEIFSTFTMAGGAVQGAARSAGRVFAVVMSLIVVGTLATVTVFATRATKNVQNALRQTEATTTTEVTLPRGVTLPPGITLPGGAKLGATTSTTGFVTPVANPRVKAPVNDEASAAAAGKAKVGRPLMASSIHLYPDGRIIFEIQAADDPKGVDNWVWKAGAVTGPEQGLIGVDPARVYPVEGIDLSNLARLCDAAIGATGIADGEIESPYLLKIGTGLRWYIPVKSLSRSSNAKTYRVAPDGTKPEVF